MKKFLIIFMSALLCLSTTYAQTKKKGTSKKATATAVKKKASAGKGKKSGTAAISTTEIKGLRSEQARIKQNIRKQEQALRANKAAVAQKLKDLDRITGDVNRHQQSIDSINTDIHRIDNNIGILSSQLDNLNSQLEQRKAAYIKSMRYMAKQHGIENKLMFIFSAKSLSEIYRRMRFVRQYAAFQRTQGKAVEEKQTQVNSKRSQLHSVRGEKRVMLNKGYKEKQALITQKDEQQKLVTSLKGQQKTIQAVIDDQKKKDAALNAQIDKLVAIEVEKARQRAIAEAKKKAEAAAAAKKAREAELARKKAEAEAKAKENALRIAEAKAAEEKAKAEARAAARDAAARARAEQIAKEAEAARVAAERKAEADRIRSEKDVAAAKKESEATATMSTVDRAASGSFEANKGRMPNPIAGGRIVSHYGQHSVEGLSNVVLDNKGINILGSPGAAARSIFDGEVSAVFNVGGSMGVIVRHGTYLSVYCNLRSVSVSSGQHVSKGQTVGTVGHDNILQFQLRKERTKLNPEAWIR